MFFLRCKASQNFAAIYSDDEVDRSKREDTPVLRYGISASRFVRNRDESSRIRRGGVAVTFNDLGYC